MEIVTVIIVLITIACIVTILIFMKNKRNSQLHEIEDDYGNESNEMIASHHPLSEGQIQFQMLPTTQNIDESRLVQIEDNRVINHLTNFVPESLKFLVNVDSVKQYKNVVKTRGEIYQAIIPKGAVLDKSRAIEGASRGTYRAAGNIKGHANWMPVKSKVNKMARVNVTNAAMGVGAMVVGQYYMGQINTELKELKDDITKVADFQDNEYRSKVFALVTQVQKTSDFQIDILENEELKRRELFNLDNWEQTCIELLGQANLTIEDFSKDQILNFEQYEKVLKEIQKWIIYQNSLLNVLYKIADLKHTLNLGSVSRDICNTLSIKYSKQVNEVQGRLKKWHYTQIENIGIDVYK